MKNFLLEQQQKEKNIEILTSFIQSNPDARELKRALVIKMLFEGDSYSKIVSLIGIHKSYITILKRKFEAQGLEGIKLGYQGSKGYLTPEQREEVINWLKTRSYWILDELVTYLDEQYGVIYQSKQSYYDLLSSAGISWKKSQKKNPKYNSELVKEKKKEIIDFMAKNQSDIESGQLSVFFMDECHLLHNDLCGYVWGNTKERVEIPIKNIKDKSTYFGALDYHTGEFIVREYPTGNASNTISFIKDLQEQRSGQRIALIWDGASYHVSAEIKEFLASVNGNNSPDDWLITCIKFAPNAPQQNPVEDIWLQAKNFLRKFWYLGKSFAVIKWLFKFFTNHQRFDFPKIHQYTPCL